MNYPHPSSRMPLPFAQYIYTTNDGGGTWTPKASPVKIGTIFFLDAKLGWMLGKSDPDPTQKSILFRTIDGGNTWMQISSDSPVPLGSTLQFIDDMTGFAYSSFITADFYVDFDNRLDSNNSGAAIFTTADGGRSWTEIQPIINP